MIAKTAFFIAGILASLWVIIRLLPKPSRANYPCMRVAFPVATSFVIYLSGLVSSVYLFRKAGQKIKERKLIIGISFAIIALSALTVGLMNKQGNAIASANITESNRFDDPLGPNAPIGDAKGIFPGRVVWVHNPDATNANCTNNDRNDAYFNDENTDQSVTDAMFAEGIKNLTGKETCAEAWNSLFTYFNNQHGNGETGYKPEESIFIKINAVTAYNGATPNGDMPASIPIEYDTTPQAMLTILRQLVNEAGVHQEKIFIGDPLCDIWNHIYNKLKAEFPNVNYVSKRTISGRYKLTASSTTGIYYSDKGTVMTQIKSHKFFKEMMDAKYIINIPTMKGHRWGGITFFAKNHFGSNTSDGSWQLHKGLMDANDNYDEEGRRYDYRLYRVFVDLMGSKNLGGKTLLYFMDALWSTSHEHQKPQKFITSPFNNHWSSSFILTLDPVAGESVCLDIMQKEFSEEDLTTDPPRYSYVMWAGIDDYLHQAASSDWWPEGITYDPDNRGTPIGSLGVHEHWNNTDEMKYSRNLETGNGIELVQIEQRGSLSTKLSSVIDGNIKLYPNPVIDEATLLLNNRSTAEAAISIYSISGKLVKSFNKKNEPYTRINLSTLTSGNYILKAETNDKIYTAKFIKM